MAKVSIFFGTNIFLCIFVWSLLHTEAILAQNEQGSVLKKVVIDPGHGGFQPGAVGARTKEKDIVLDISLKVGKMIQEKYPDVEVIYTRKTDVAVDIEKRGDIANKANANLFISIHVNSVAKGSKCPSGVETFVMGNSSSAANMEVARLENSVILLEDDYTTRYEDFDPDNAESYIIFSQMQNSFLNQSLEFAGELQEQFRNFAKRYDRGVKQAGFIVLWKTAMPSVLIEAGFICHPEEEKYISSEEGKGKLATSIFLAFCSYKTKIEERSSFRLGEHTPSNTRPQTDSATSKPQQETTTANIQPKPEMKTPKVEFCVQIGTSTKPKDTNPNNFHRYKNVERIQVSANYYKYIIGRTADYATARETMRNVRADFKDAFVAGIVNGKIVSATEAMKLINN